jgi:hypothetical protein
MICQSLIRKVKIYCFGLTRGAYDCNNLVLLDVNTNALEHFDVRLGWVVKLNFFNR